MLRVVAKSWWLDNPTAKTILTFRKVIVYGVVLKSFDCFFPNGSVEPEMI